MPLYFFDTLGPDGDCRDDEGCLCEGTDDVRRLAQRALCEIAGGREHDVDQFAYSIRVRDPGGAEIYEAALTLTGGLLRQDASLAPEQSCHDPDARAPARSLRGRSCL